jgi:ribosome biogenesis GTPase A
MEQKVKNVHWFPGHMKKASIKLEEQVKLVDFVIVLLDSRIPLSSKSDLLEKIVQDKKKLYILTKTDLSDEEMTNKWVQKLNENGDKAIALNLKDNNSKKEAVRVCEEFASLKA